MITIIYAHKSMERALNKLPSTITPLLFFDFIASFIIFYFTILFFVKKILINIRNINQFTIIDLNFWNRIENDN